MKKVTASIVAGLLMVGLISVPSVFAGRIKHRQIHQQKRIHSGIVSGQLTRKEVAILEHQQHRIQVTKRIAWSDGVLTPKERFQIELMQDRASADIFRLKHNPFHY